MVSPSDHSDKFFGTALIVALAIGLALARTYSFLLFHSLVEVFTIAVAWSIFFLAWNARRFLDNHYLLFVGIASLFVGVLDALHMLAYEGMGTFPAHGANLPTQLWIASRYLESCSLLIAPLFLRRRLNFALTFGTYMVAVSALTATVFSRHFPVCYVEGVGLTHFKIASEYVIATLLLASVLLLYRFREEFDRPVILTLSAAIVLNTCAELAFTSYTSVYGHWNEIGHLLGFIAYCLIYRAIIVKGMMSPYDLLFRNLARNEEALRVANEKLGATVAALKRSEERYRVFVANSSEGICRIEAEPPIPISLPEEEQVRLIRECGRIAECNEVYARMHGAKVEEIVGLPFSRILERSDPRVTELVKRFVRSGYGIVETEAAGTDATGVLRCIVGSFTGVIENGKLVRAWSVQRDVTETRQAALERERLIAELQRALAEVKNLSGLLPICANCKKIRDDQGYWTQVEAYLEQRADVSFSHGICPECARQLYPDYFTKIV